MGTTPEKRRKAIDAVIHEAIAIEWQRRDSILDNVMPLVEEWIAEAEARGRALGRFESTVGHKPEPRDPNYQAGYSAGRQDYADKVERAFARPPTWGPDENGDVWLDMRAEDFLVDLHALRSDEPRTPRRRARERDS